MGFIDAKNPKNKNEGNIKYTAELIASRANANINFDIIYYLFMSFVFQCIFKIHTVTQIKNFQQRVFVLNFPIRILSMYFYLKLLDAALCLMGHYFYI